MNNISWFYDSYHTQDAFSEEMVQQQCPDNLVPGLKKKKKMEKTQPMCFDFRKSWGKGKMCVFL